MCGCSTGRCVWVQRRVSQVSAVQEDDEKFDDNHHYNDNCDAAAAAADNDDADCDVVDNNDADDNDDGGYGDNDDDSLAHVTWFPERLSTLQSIGNNKIRFWTSGDKMKLPVLSKTPSFAPLKFGNTSNFISHFIVNVITFPCWDLSMLLKAPLETVSILNCWKNGIIKLNRPHDLALLAMSSFDTIPGPETQRIFSQDKFTVKSLI